MKETGMTSKWLKQICIKWVEGNKSCKKCNHLDHCHDWVRDNYHSRL